VWIVYKLLWYRDKLNEIPLLSFRKSLASPNVGLRDFNHSIAMHLIASVDDHFFKVCFREGNTSVAQSYNQLDEFNIGFE
jgi:hypothetical protein